jgi:hypothetical protein
MDVNTFRAFKSFAIIFFTDMNLSRIWPEREKEKEKERQRERKRGM